MEERREEEGTDDLVLDIIPNYAYVRVGVHTRKANVPPSQGGIVRKISFTRLETIPTGSDEKDRRSPTRMSVTV